MKVKVKISIDFNNDIKAKAIYSSLKPDNINLPKGLSIEMNVDKTLLMINFSSVSKLETLISTIDDLLTCCQASVNTLKEIEQIS
jgi:tRNA threonylcarbamoyladenosine modification (KEOPS) complex  Pcc1 subunit